MAIIGKYLRVIEIKKRKDVRMDWLGETAHKKSCVLIWKLNKSSQTCILQLVDKLNNKSVCTTMSKKQLLQLSEDIQNFLNKEVLISGSNKD